MFLFSIQPCDVTVTSCKVTLLSNMKNAIYNLAIILILSPKGIQALPEQESRCAVSLKSEIISKSPIYSAGMFYATALLRQLQLYGS